MLRIAIPILTPSGVWTTILVLSVVVVGGPTVGHPLVVGTKGREIEGVVEVVVVEVFVVLVVVVIEEVVVVVVEVAVEIIDLIVVSAVVIVVFSVSVVYVHASVVVTTVLQSQE